MRVRTNNARNGSKTNASNKMPTNSAGATSNNCCHQSAPFVLESDTSANTMYAMIAASNGTMIVKTEGAPQFSWRVCVFMLLDGPPERH
jgi:predicted lipoprotein with Yx(FWY)xxD motif